MPTRFLKWPWQVEPTLGGCAHKKNDRGRARDQHRFLGFNFHE